MAERYPYVAKLRPEIFEEFKGRTGELEYRESKAECLEKLAISKGRTLLELRKENWPGPVIDFSDIDWTRLCEMAKPSLGGDLESQERDWEYIRAMLKSEVFNPLEPATEIEENKRYRELDLLELQTQFEKVCKQKEKLFAMVITLTTAFTRREFARFKHSQQVHELQDQILRTRDERKEKFRAKMSELKEMEATSSKIELEQEQNQMLEHDSEQQSEDENEQEAKSENEPTLVEDGSISSLSRTFSSFHPYA